MVIRCPIPTGRVVEIVIRATVVMVMHCRLCFYHVRAGIGNHGALEDPEHLLRIRIGELRPGFGNKQRRRQSSHFERRINHFLITAYGDQEAGNKEKQAQDVDFCITAYGDAESGDCEPANSSATVPRLGRRPQRTKATARAFDSTTRPLTLAIATELAGCAAVAGTGRSRK